VSLIKHGGRRRRTSNVTWQDIHTHTQHIPHKHTTHTTHDQAKEEFEGQLTTISRQGSGSSCRSLFGGYAEWRVGSKEDGTDSIAAEVAPRSHWPEMRALILVARATAKDVGSTTGMQRTLATSPLLQARIEGVEARMTAMTKHIMARDFAEFGKLTMIDSNQFHATCLDTYPPIFYLNETSRMVGSATTLVFVFSFSFSFALTRASTPAHLTSNSTKRHAWHVLRLLLSRSFVFYFGVAL
jgi:diphosphomevalonate decarboxylase